MLSDVAPKFRRRYGRVRFDAPSAPPTPSAVTVVSVASYDEQRVLWNFSSPVVGISDVSGLLMFGNPPDELDGITAQGAVLVRYTDLITPGDPWEIRDDIPVVLSFASGGALEIPQSGTVTP